MKELDVVRLKRSRHVSADICGALTVSTEMPQGTTGTIVDMNATHAMVECVNSTGGGFTFTVLLDELELVEQ